jgi:hypothetical protein
MCFSETKNRQKAPVLVSQKPTLSPNLCHTHGVTATNMQPVGGGGARIVPMPSRGSARSAWREWPGSNICEATWSGGTLRVVTTRGPSQSPRQARPANRPVAAFPKAEVRLRTRLTLPPHRDYQAKSDLIRLNPTIQVHTPWKKHSLFPLLWSHGPMVPWSSAPVVPLSVVFSKWSRCSQIPIETSKIQPNKG